MRINGYRQGPQCHFNCTFTFGESLEDLDYCKLKVANMGNKLPRPDIPRPNVNIPRPTLPKFLQKASSGQAEGAGTAAADGKQEVNEENKENVGNQQAATSPAGNTNEVKL